MVEKNIFRDSIFRNKISGNENQSICQTPLKKKETRGWRASRGSSWDVHSLLSLQQRSNCTQVNLFSFCCLSPVAQFSHHLVWDNVQNRLWSTSDPKTILHACTNCHWETKWACGLWWVIIIYFWLGRLVTRVVSKMVQPHFWHFSWSQFLFAKWPPLICF